MFMLRNLKALKKMADAATVLPGEKEQKIPRRHYSATIILISLLLILSEGLSLRGARAAFVRCYFWLQRKMPSHTAIRDWIMQVGYYKLTTITRLYAQNAHETEDRKIPVMHDIAHKIANLLAVEAEELEQHRNY